MNQIDVYEIYRLKMDINLMEDNPIRTEHIYVEFLFDVNGCVNKYLFRIIMFKIIPSHQVILLEQRSVLKRIRINFILIYSI